MWGPKTQNLLRYNVETSQQDSLRAVFRMPQSPDNLIMTQFDMTYLQQFYTMWPHSRTIPRLFRSQVRSKLGIPLYNVGIHYDTSISYRYAILTFMSFLKNEQYQRDVCYLPRYYQAAQKCIDDGSTAELVFASYLLAISSLMGGEPIENVIVKCTQFCESVCSAEEEVSLYSWRFGVFMD